MQQANPDPNLSAFVSALSSRCPPPNPTSAAIDADIQIPIHVVESLGSNGSSSSSSNPVAPPRSANTRVSRFNPPQSNDDFVQYQDADDGEYPYQADQSGWGTRDQQEDQYFNSYAQLSIHEEMLKDSTRTLAYKKAIFDNAHHFKGKVVLDVGCGTGVLSIFAAQAGAKKVYAVDASDIVEFASYVVRDNGLSDVITLYKTKVEDLVLPEKVDIIISEWMGYFLIYEAMFQTVLRARDAWLKPGGIIFPSEAKLYLAAYADEEFVSTKIDFWKNVYGVNMSAMVPSAQYFALYPGCCIDTLNGDAVVSNPVLLRSFDCTTVTAEDLDITFSNFDFTIKKNCAIQGFVGWFDVIFDPAQKTPLIGEKEEKEESDQAEPIPEGANPTPVVLTTAPGASYTHWHQTLFVYDRTLPAQKDDHLQGNILVRPHPRAPRHLEMKIDSSLNGVSFQRDFEF